MKLPLQITFRDMDPSPSIDAAIRERAARLDRFYGRIMGCQVTVEARHHRQHKGKLYNVRVHLTVPGAEISGTHSRPKDHAHEDVYVAIRDAFDAIARQLEEHARVARGDVKSHETPMHGKVIRIGADYGFIETADGNDVYFHRNSVVESKFDDLEVGSEVRVTVAERESEKGWQATTVHPVGKHHLAD
jgi:ribosomal subunit interface protein